MTTTDVIMRHHAGKRVAYVDESYTSPKDFPGQNSFYILTAYVVEIDDLPEIEGALRTEIGGGYWHTVKAAQTQPGRERISQLCDWLTKEPDDSLFIVSMKVPIDSFDEEGELAREECMRKLFTSLNTWNNEDLRAQVVVIEERGTQSQKKRDNVTVSRWLKESDLSHSQFSILFGSPRENCCLWIPDLISYVLRPNVQDKHPQWLPIIRDRIQYI